VRRHPLIGRPFQLLLGIVVSLVLVVGVATRLTATPSSTVSVTITSAPGETLAFERAETTVRASGPITVMFRNASSLSHNLVFTAGVTGATRTIVEPGTSDQVLLRPPGPGTYPFACTIHEGMTGTLVVIDGEGSTVTRGGAPTGG
jgi:plastocyanin